MTQTELRTKTAVSKSAQLRYESGETSPDVGYLDLLDGLGFDLMYLLKGVRAAEALEPELQNLIEAYTDAPPDLRRAAFGVLISPFVRSMERARVEPGWYRHEVRGEGDLRYAQFRSEPPLTIHEERPKFPGRVEPPREESGPALRQSGNKED